jgi:16S rRNA (adenine1518-N6/adenine1519-N6)-dimethyltransferase
MPDAQNNDSALFHIPHLLHTEGIKLKKKYGQHFLANWRTLKSIVNRCNLNTQTTAIEIGAGIGNLTKLLAERAASVLAIEADRSLSTLHQRYFKDNSNVEFIYQNVLEIDFHSLVTNPENTVVVGNIPYQITSPIIFKLIEDEIKYARILLLMQKEVAERITAQPGTKKFGILTLKTAFFCRTRIEFYIKPQRFIPPPKVQSALLLLLPHKTLPIPDKTTRQLFFKFIDFAFAQRRKTLANSLANSELKNINKNLVESALSKMNLNPRIRPESLSLRQFLSLFNDLLDHLSTQ